MKRKSLFEALGGSADNSIGEFLSALNRAVSNLVTANLDQFDNCTYPYIYVCDVLGDMNSGSCIFCFCGTVSETYMVNYKSTRNNISFVFEFDSITEVKKSITYQSIDDGDEPVTINNNNIVVNLESEKIEITKPSLENTFESLITDDKHVTLSGRVSFETSKDTAEANFKSTGVLKGKAVCVSPNKYTANKNRYTKEFINSIDKELKSLIENNGDVPVNESVRSPWPNLSMMASHAPAMEKESPDRFFAICAKITGTFTKGSLWGVTFETLDSPAGHNMARLLLENIVKFVSLRVHIQDATENDEGGLDVTRGSAEGFGADFTFSPAMTGVRENPITVENDINGGEMKITSFEQLKEASPELYESLKKRLDAGETQVSLLEEANNKLAETTTKLSTLETDNENLRKQLFETRVDRACNKFVKSLIETYQGILKDDKVIKKNTAEKLISEIEPLMRSEIETIMVKRPNLDTESLDFKDIVNSSCDKIFTNRVESIKSMLAEYAKDTTFTGAPDLSKVEDAPEGEEGMGNPTIGTLDSRISLIESENEMVGLPRQKSGQSKNAVPAPIKDVMLSAANGNMKMYESDGNGGFVHVMEKVYPKKYKMAQELRKNYMFEPSIVSEGGPFSYNDAELFAQPKVESLRKKLTGRYGLEAGEVTSGSLLGTLWPDIRQGIIEQAYALSSWMSYATLRPINSDTYDVYRETYRHHTDWSYGTITKSAGSWGAFSAGSGVISQAHRAWIKLTSATTTTVASTVTVTYTNQNGITGLTTTVVVPIGTTQNTYIQIKPALVGDQFTNITSATISNSDGSNGEVFAFVTEQPTDQNTELAVSGRASLQLTKSIATVNELDLEFVLSWRALEDAMKSFANNGPGAYNTVGRMIFNIGMDMANIIDRRGYTALNNSTNHDTTNDVTFDATDAGVPGTYTKAEWYSTLHDTLVKQSERLLEYGFFKPNRLSINHTDTHKLLWMKSDFITRFPQRAEDFFRTMSWGVVAGMEVIPAAFQPKGNMLLGNGDWVQHVQYIPMELRGPYSYIANQKVDTYVARQRSSDDFQRNNTRAKVSITEQ